MEVLSMARAQLAAASEWDRHHQRGAKLVATLVDLTKRMEALEHVQSVGSEPHAALNNPAVPPTFRAFPDALPRALHKHARSVERVAKALGDALVGLSTAVDAMERRLQHARAWVESEGRDKATGKLVAVGGLEPSLAELVAVVEDVYSMHADELFAKESAVEGVDFYDADAVAKLSADWNAMRCVDLAMLQALREQAAHWVDA